MSLLTGIHGDEEARAPVVSERPRVTRASRARGRGASWARQRTDWLELPTTLTCWRHTGDAYQVLIEPAAAGHELVEVRGSTQASIEYTGGALELITSLMGMVQRREALLSLYGIQIPPILITPVTAAAPAPAVPPPAVGRKERQTPARSRGRARGIRAESGPSEPILSDDDVETSDFEEGASQHSESSESGDDDTEEGTGAKSGDDVGSGSGSDSDSDADRDSAPESSPLRKRTKRASRA